MTGARRLSRPPRARLGDEISAETPTREERARPSADGGGNGAAAEPAGSGPPPKLADGVELAGQFEDSGYKNPPFIARRADGQTIQLAELLYRIAERADGRRSDEEIASEVSEAVGRQVSGENVRMLVDKRLRPLGVLAQADGSSPQLKKLDPLLALRFRAAVVPEGATRTLTSIFYPLYYPPVIVAVLAAIVAVDVWLFFVHGVAQSMRGMLYNPLLMLVVLGLVAVGTAFHEIGHATALRYGGGNPGAMGAGIYIVWPAFYTDVTDAYRLGRWGRVRTDLGGVYFNAIFVLGAVGAYALTGFEVLLVLVLVTHLQVLQQFLPFLRLDGYYLVADLTGVPDLFARIKPTLKSALPGGEEDARAEELKPWVRRVTTGWVVVLIPVLAFVFGMMIFNAPRMFATGYDSFFLQAGKLSDAFGRGNVLMGAVGAVQCLFLVLPMAGITYTFGRTSTRIAGGAWSWSDGSPVRRGAVAAIGAGLLAVAGFVLLPNGDYQPIQRAEKGTVQGGVEQVSQILTGRPGLTEEREQELGGVTVERGGDNGADQEKKTTTGSSTETETGPGTGTTTTTTTQTETNATTSAPTTTGTVETSTTQTTTTVEAP